MPFLKRVETNRKEQNDGNDRSADDISGPRRDNGGGEIDVAEEDGMAETFARTLKRDYARVSPKPNARAVFDQLPRWFAHYNEVHPHRALGYRSRREFIARSTQEELSAL